MTGILIYVLASVGFEILEGFIHGPSLGWIRKAATLGEEVLEMVGTIVILWGLLVHNQVLLEK